MTTDIFTFKNHTPNMSFIIFSLEHHHFLVLLHRAASHFLQSDVLLRLLAPCPLSVVVLLLYSIHLCFFFLWLLPTFIQIHRAVSVWRLSDLIKACSSIYPCHSATNPLASHCRLSKTGEQSRAGLLAATKRNVCKICNI